ncbi:MAG: thiamine biosynthesis protein [Thaumarchaeota archaeon]|nr:thiamine biosynthesis protein [Nitrososphaerota archaeon]
MYNSCIVVFPSVYSQNKLNILKDNIRKILKIKNQKFTKIITDEKIIIIHANDPVFASSSICMLTGINKVAIARKVDNEFDVVVNEITKITSDLLLNNEKFYIKVDKNNSKYISKDIEIAATSSIIEKIKNRNIKPANENECDKIIVSHLTKSNAYICIFVDDGVGGSPYNAQKTRILCCVYNEISFIICIKCIKAGFDVKIIACYQSYKDLIKTTKLVNKIISKVPKEKIELEFFKLDRKMNSIDFILVSNIISVKIAQKNNIKWVQLPLPPNVVPMNVIDYIMKNIYKKKMNPVLSLHDLIINESLKKEIKKLTKLKINKTIQNSIHENIANKAFQNRKKIIVNNETYDMHKILDKLK